MTKIYISYSRKDRELVFEVANRLRNDGNEIFFDDAVLSPGRDWRATLDEGLKNADIFLVFLSNNSLVSHYALMEVGAARAFAGVSGKPFVIPIAIDEIETPLALQDIQILFAPDRDVVKIVEGINRGISSQLGLLLAREAKAEQAAVRLEENAPSYIDEAIRAQAAIRLRNAWAARFWYGAGFLSLLAGIAAILFILASHTTAQGDWLNLARAIIVNIVIVGFLGACARYAFSLGKSYTSEALKASDRIHAIMFGRFYLKAFPDRVTWGELKEVFAHWNIDRSSTFSNLDVSHIDPQVLTMISQIAGALTKKADA